MLIRKADINDVPRILEIFEIAKKFMRAHDNMTQWSGAYPEAIDVIKDIENGHSYVIEIDYKIVATFAYIYGDDPTYAVIESGNWLNDKPYGVIHRVASDGTTRGIGEICINFAFEKCYNLRIDTHRDNYVMHNMLIKCGFVECGIIYVRDGSPRVAYQKIT